MTELGHKWGGGLNHFESTKGSFQGYIKTAVLLHEILPLCDSFVNKSSLGTLCVYK